MAENTWPSWTNIDFRALAHSKISWLPPLLVTIIAGALLLQPPPSTSSLIDSGDQSFKQNNLDSSFHYYHQALLADPKNSAIHLKLARVYEAANNFDLAIAEESEAQMENPQLNLQTDIARLTEIRDKPQQLRQQVAALANLTATYPDFRDAWVRLAYLHYQLKEDLDAKTALNKALAIDPIYEPTVSLLTLLP